ncbi:MAG: SRPBCC domain-containing protein [Rhodobacteraceae bacterium]|jgi:uncharacterized protein YndB with AHSA1/START domain|nr:SRPBCC domain-containing protein [Paracoccaceae bacterium]
MPELIIEAPSPRQILLRRHVPAPPALVYRAHVDTALIPQWMNVLPGWSMPVAETDPRPGGRFRFAWDDGTGKGFRIEGEYLEIEEGRRILHVERMFLPDPTPDNRVETRFDLTRGGTALSVLMTLPDPATVAAMLQTGMTDGMEKTYDRLDLLLAQGTRQ